jgi:hypothetical protein
MDSHANWLAAGCGDDDSENILISPFQDIFPKREMFDDIDLSNIPMSSLFTGQEQQQQQQLAPGADLGDISSSPTSLTPSSSISSASGTNPLGYDNNALFGPDSAGFFSSPRPIDSQPLPPLSRLQSTPVSNASVTTEQLAPQQQQQQHIRAPMISMPSQVKSSATNAGTASSKLAPAVTDSPRAKAPETQPAPITPPQPSRKLSLPPSSSSQHSRFQTPPRKRKSTSASSSSSRSSISPPPTSGSSSTPSHPLRKTTHNMIEKRYRTNLNDKIAALRDAVPSLRLMAQRMDRDGNGLMLAGDGSGIIMDDAIAADVSLEVEQHMLGGLAPAHKLNKATVLSKATEYIAHLERNNQNLTREIGFLRNRLSGLEMMVMMQQPQSHAPPPQAHPQRVDAGFGGMW